MEGPIDRRYRGMVAPPGRRREVRLSLTPTGRALRPFLPRPEEADHLESPTVLFRGLPSSGEDPSRDPRDVFLVRTKTSRTPSEPTPVRTLVVRSQDRSLTGVLPDPTWFRVRGSSSAMELIERRVLAEVTRGVSVSSEGSRRRGAPGVGNGSQGPV